MLPGNSITDEGLKHLAGLDTLSRLHVGDTQVTEQGARALRKAIPDLMIEMDSMEDGDFGNYYIRDGIIVVPKNAIIPNGTVI